MAKDAERRHATSSRPEAAIVRRESGRRMSEVKLASSAHVLAAIASSTEYAWLEVCHKHNERIGNAAVAEASAARLRDLKRLDMLQGRGGV